MKRPLTMADVESKYPALLAGKDEAIHTFSNGTDGYGWMECNCFDCRFYEHEGNAGEYCAFEAAAMLDMVTPEMARLFGWTQHTTEYGPLSGWRPPQQCAFFHERPENDDDDSAPPPPPDPYQLVLIADPTEILGQITVPRDVPALTGAPR